MNALGELVWLVLKCCATVVHNKIQVVHILLFLMQWILDFLSHRKLFLLTIWAITLLILQLSPWLIMSVKNKDCVKSIKYRFILTKHLLCNVLSDKKCIETMDMYLINNNEQKQNLTTSKVTLKQTITPVKSLFGCFKKTKHFN